MLFFIHGLAISVLMMIAVPLWLAVVAILFVMLSLIYYTKKTREVVRIVMRSNGDWLIQKSDGYSCDVRLAGNTYVGNRLILLVFTSHESSLPTCVCILEGSVKAVVFSQIAMRLKVSGQQLSASA